MGAFERCPYGPHRPVRSLPNNQGGVFRGRGLIVQCIGHTIGYGPECLEGKLTSTALFRPTDYWAGGKGVFRVCAGQFSHTNELGLASTISSRLWLRRLKTIGREQVEHLGHGLYIVAPCAYCRPTQRGVSSTVDMSARIDDETKSARLGKDR